MRKINIAMIGYRFMGKAHSHAYKDLSMFFRVGVIPVMKVICGRNKEALKEAADMYGWEEVETSWEKVVERDDIDLIDICTPNYTHKDIAIKAAENGKMILCEKPLAANLTDAYLMLEAVERGKVKHMIDFNYRKVPAITFAKQLIDEGFVGEIYHFRGVFLQDWIVDPNFPLVWRLQQQEAGSGAHGDLNAHIIDLARFLVGDIDKVIGISQTFIKERPLVREVSQLTTGLSAVAEEKVGKVTVDDATIFLAKFKNGALGTFEATRFATGNRCGLRFEINGSKGSIRFKFDDMNYLEVFSREDPETRQGFKKITVTESLHPYMANWWPAGHGIGYEHTFVHIIYDFMKAIEEDTLPSPNFYDGVECQKTLDAVERSIREERWVKV